MMGLSGHRPAQARSAALSLTDEKPVHPAGLVRPLSQGHRWKIMSAELGNAFASTDEALSNPPVRYFSHDVPESIDLSTIEDDEEVFGGGLASVITRAHKILIGLSGKSIRNLLLLGDFSISQMISHKVIVFDQLKEQRILTEDLLSYIPEITFAKFLASALGNAPVKIDDEESTKSPPYDATPARFLAAFALAQAYLSTRHGTHIDWLSINGGYHAMQAAEAIAISELLSGNESFVAPLIGMTQLEILAKRGAAARLERDADGKQAAKVKAHDLYLNWQAGHIRFKSGAAFARHIVDTLPIENTKTVERWMKKWRDSTK